MAARALRADPARQSLTAAAGQATHRLGYFIASLLGAGLYALSGSFGLVFAISAAWMLAVGSLTLLCLRRGVLDQPEGA